jgi:hypothetical protein
MKETLQKAANKGRHGDKVLVHMNQKEVDVLANQAGYKNAPRNPDTGLQELFPWLAVAMVAKQGYDMYSGYQGANKQIDALNKYKSRSQGEIRMANQMERKSMQGGINVGQQVNRASTQAQEIARQQNQSTMGSLYGSGLENSVIADELKRKVSQGTLQTIAAESTKLAEANAKSQEQATQDFGNYSMQRKKLLDDIATQQDQIRTQRDQNLTSGLIGMGLQAAGGIEAGFAGGGDFDWTTAMNTMAHGGNYNASGQLTPNLPMGENQGPPGGTFHNGQWWVEDPEGNWVLAPKGSY